MVMEKGTKQFVAGLPSGGLVRPSTSNCGGLLGLGQVFVLVVALGVALIGGLSTDQIVTRTIPNEGIRRSLRNALISFLALRAALRAVSGWSAGCSSG